ncbi:MAG: PKD domain-containing protein [Gammaproteobacteria bacterium]
MSSHKSILAIAFLGFILIFVAWPSRVLAVNANHVQTINTDQFNPPSPDPSGISYICAPQPPLACADRLLISDGEVEEIPSPNPGAYQGANLFETTLSGSLVGTSSTTGADPNDAVSSSQAGNFSNEPTGVAWNPINGHCFYSDDDRDIVFDINPGPDGDCLTPGDNLVVAAVRVRDLGNTDPEGVGIDAFDDPSGQVALYIADGINTEVWKHLLGADGQLAGGDDTVSHFDSSLLGLTDVEGVDYHPDFGHLFLVSPGEENTLVQATPAGGLVRILDISSVNPRNPAGVAVAPWSGVGVDPNPERNIYVSDRRVDNDSDITENDGQVYEFDISALPTSNSAPVVDAGPDRTIYEPGSASLDGTVTDDGLPPPPVLTTNWSKFTGPGTANFASPSAVDTTVSFSATGTYQLLLTADDGGVTGSDLVTVTVLPKVAASTIYVSTASGGSVGGFSFGDEDIFAYNVNTGAWSLYFDGSDVGLGASSVDVDAFHRVTSDTVPNCPNGGILLSTTTAVTLTVNGASTLVDDSDIVCFIPTTTGSTTAGTYQWYFDGSDVGLDTEDEDIDVIAFAPDGRLVLSTIGGFSVAGASGSDEDLIVFTGSLGEATSGSFAMYFDGSDVGLQDGGNNEDVNGGWIHANGEIYLSTNGNFSVTGASGDAEDMFICGSPLSTGTSTACTYRSYWDGNTAGLAAGLEVDGADVVP